MMMGQSWKLGLKSVLFPIFNALDKNESIIRFASTYIYTKPRHADYFVTSLLLVIISFLSFTLVLYWQIIYGQLPWWLIFSYYCNWVGIGGRTMGSAYTLAHKEVSDRLLPFLCIKLYAVIRDTINQCIRNG